MNLRGSHFRVGGCRLELMRSSFRRGAPESFRDLIVQRLREASGRQRIRQSISYVVQWLKAQALDPFCRRAHGRGCRLIVLNLFIVVPQSLLENKKILMCHNFTFNCEQRVSINLFIIEHQAIRAATEQLPRFHSQI